MNKDLGKAGFAASRKSRADMVMMEPPMSVLFVDNTKNGILAVVKKELEMGMKYCPSLDIKLPVYKHMEYKPRHSAKQNSIFKLDTDTHILET